MDKVPQRTNRGNRSANRYTGGRPRRWRVLKLHEADAQLLESVLEGLDLADALRRIAAAAELAALAAELHARAAAMQREVARPPTERVSTQRGQQNKGGRPSTFWVQVLRRARPGDADNIVVRLSTSLYYAAGSPERLDVQRLDGRLVLIPARGDHGYKVMVNAGGIRIAAAGSRDLLPPDDGKYAATINAAGDIEVGAPTPSLQ